MSIFQHPFAETLVLLQRRNLPLSFPHESLLAYASFALQACILPVSARHDERADCISVSSRTLDSVFGRGKFRALNGEVGWIETAALPGGSEYRFQPMVGAGVTRAYTLTPSGLEALTDVLGKEAGHVARSAGSRTPRHYGYALQSIMNNGTHARGGFMMPSRVKLNRKALRDLLDELALLKSDEEMLMPSKQLLQFAERLMQMAPEDRMRTILRYQIMTRMLLREADDAAKRGSKGVVQRYRQSEAGRWYGAADGLSLQNIPRELRRAAFRGNYLIDVDNCHFTLLAQMAQRIELDTPNIDALLADKELFRRDISAEVGTGVAEIKEALISLLFGAQLHGANSSLHELFNSDQLERFRASAVIRGLAEEIRECAPAVVASYRAKTKKSGALINDLGKSITASTKDSKQAIAFLLQGAEAQILCALGAKYGKYMRLLLHDGFISAQRLELEHLIAHVQRQTGWKIRLSREIL